MAPAAEPCKHRIGSDEGSIKNLDRASGASIRVSGLWQQHERTHILVARRRALEQERKWLGGQSLRAFSRSEAAQDRGDPPNPQQRAPRLRVIAAELPLAQGRAQLQPARASFSFGVKLR